jgi:hypothetical protein
MCKHFASYQDYTNYKWDLIQQPKGYFTKHATT